MRLEEDSSVISAGEFMDAVNRVPALARQVDRRVIELALPQLSKHPDTSYAINLTAATLNDSTFLGFLKDVLLDDSIDPKRIHFEITEQAVLESLKSKALLQGLKALGFKVGLDDFGTGFSSFRYLQQVQIDFLKIDGSFVQDLLIDSTARAIVRCMMSLSADLGIAVIAEFVGDELTEAGLLSLQAEVQQCQAGSFDLWGQGWLYGKPLPCY